MSALDEADKLMGMGKTQEAKDLLMQELRQSDDKGVYADAVAIFLAGAMYDDAKHVFAMYEEKTGKNLGSGGGSDFSLEDIEAEEAKNQPLDPNEQHFRAKRRMSSIREIIVTPERLVIRRRDGDHSYPWGSVEGTIVTARWRYGLWYRVTLTTPDGRVKFKVVPAIPRSWENERKLLPALRPHMQLVETKPSLLSQALPWVVGAAGIAILYYFGRH